MYAMDLDLFVQIEPALGQVRQGMAYRDVGIGTVAFGLKRSTGDDELVLGKGLELDPEFIVSGD